MSDDPNPRVNRANLEHRLYDLHRAHATRENAVKFVIEDVAALIAETSYIPKRYRIVAHTDGGLDQYIEDPNGPWVRAFDVFGPDTTDTKYCDLCKHSYPLPAYSSHYCPTPKETMENNNG